MLYKCAHCERDTMIDEKLTTNVCEHCATKIDFIFHMGTTFDDIVNAVRESGTSFYMQVAKIEGEDGFVAMTLFTDKMGHFDFVLNKDNLAAAQRKR